MISIYSSIYLKIYLSKSTIYVYSIIFVWIKPFFFMLQLCGMISQLAANRIRSGQREEQTMSSEHAFYQTNEKRKKPANHKTNPANPFSDSTQVPGTGTGTVQKYSPQTCATCPIHKCRFRLGGLG